MPSPKYHTSLFRNSLSAVGVHTNSRSKSANVKFNKSRLVEFRMSLFLKTTNMMRILPKMPRIMTNIYTNVMAAST